MARAAGRNVALTREGTVPTLEEYDLLRRGDEWVALSSSEALVMALLLDRVGRVVGRDRLEAAVWPQDSPPRSLLNQLVIRVRRRIAPLDLEIATVRGRGYLLRDVVAEVRTVPV
ncbi:MAG: helix-turn-helix protein [Actinomycetia bacterium]|nr:helix-turn-helix protein [Actinomycetes bacterium]